MSRGLRYVLAAPFILVAVGFGLGAASVLGSMVAGWIGSIAADGRLPSPHVAMMAVIFAVYALPCIAIAAASGLVARRLVRGPSPYRSG